MKFVKKFKTQLNRIPSSSSSYTIPVLIRDLPEGVPNKVNPRTSSRYSKSYKKNYLSLTTFQKSTEANFIDANMGIFNAVEKITFELLGGTEVWATIEGDIDNHGSYNGDHSRLAALDARKTSEFKKYHYNSAVKFHVTTGMTRAQIIDAAARSNGGEANKNYTLSYSRGELDWLESALKVTGVRENFKFEEHEGEDRGIRNRRSVLHVLRLLILSNSRILPLFNVKTIDRRYGQAYYGSLNKSYRFFAREQHKDGNETLKSSLGIISFLFSFAHKIVVSSNDAYKKERDRIYDNRESKKPSPYSKNVNIIEHMLADGVFLPIYATIRMFMDDSGVLTTSQQNIFVCLNKSLSDMLKESNRLVNRAGGIDAAGGSPEIWKQMISIMEENAKKMGIL
jgi:hypothetical protein